MYWTDTRVVLKYNNNSNSLRYLFWLNRHKSCIEIYVRILKQTTSMNWTDTRVVLKFDFCCVYFNAKTYWTDTRVVLKSGLVVVDVVVVELNRHKSCIEISKSVVKLLTVLIEPTQELYWNQLTLMALRLQHLHWTDTRVVLKSKKH